MNLSRTEIINAFISKYNYNTYLEIGVRTTALNFNNIKCLNRTGVDPNVEESEYLPQDKGYKITSDNYFITLPDTVKFDIIFLDGMHTHEQVNKDIQNSIKHLSKNGTIILHDCSPPDLAHEHIGKCGTVWRAFYEARKTYDIEAYVVESRCRVGVGVIRLGGETITSVGDDSVLDYNFLDTNRKDVLNLITSQEFIQKLNL